MIDSFENLNIRAEITNALIDMGFSAPMPIQAEVIPFMLEGKDCLAKAPTGSGKTCAFAIPALNNIDVEDQNIQVLVLCPTRELVMQTENEIKKVSKFIKGSRVLAVYGGQNIDRQLAGLRKKPQIIVGTPGRIMDHLRRRTLKLNELKLLVLDEADEMLNMGFREDIDIILGSCSKEHQTVLFSATMSKEILQISKNYQVEPIKVETISNKENIPKIKQYCLNVTEKNKIDALVAILAEKCYSLVLVFCNTKKRVDMLSQELNDYGYKAEALHGDLRQRNRDIIMKRYRGGDINVLVATDVAARGIDVDGIDAVFNFDVPFDNEYYVHRIGRTARANKEGESYSLFTNKDAFKKREIEKFTSVQMEPYKVDNANFKSEDEIKMADIFSLLSSDLEKEKELIAKELKNFNAENGTNYSFLDISAAFYKKINKKAGEKRQLPDNAAPKPKQSKKSSTATRYFMSIGLKDKLNEDSVKNFICSNSTINAVDIEEVSLLDTFSFVEVKNGFNDEMHALNGLKLNKRFVTVEVAGGKDNVKKSFHEKTFDKKSNFKNEASKKPYNKKPFSAKSRNK